MRIEELNLIAAGPFTDQSLVLTPKKSDFHMVYGPNEAGKTAALRGITSLLFGFPSRVQDDFVHKAARLRIGAGICHSNKKTLVFVRKRGRKNTLLGPRGKKSTAYADDVLDPFLGDLDEATFRTVFGVSYQDLVEGGRTLEKLKGLVGDSLFAAGLGGPGLDSVLKQLDADCRDLYERGKSRPQITKAIERFSEAVQARNDAAASAHEWSTVTLRQQEVGKRRAELQGELAAAEGRARRIDRLLQARHRVVDRERALATLKELKDAKPLPDGYSKKNRATWQKKLEEAGADVERIEGELDGESGIRAKMKKIDVPQHLLDKTETILDLFQRVEGYRTGRKDLDEKLIPDRENLRNQRERLLRECGLDRGLETLDGHRIPADKRAAVTELANREGVSREKHRVASELIGTLDARLAKQRDELEGLGGERDAGALSSAIEAATAPGDIDSGIESARQDVARENDAAVAALRRLGLEGIPADEVDSLPVPAKATLDRFEEEFGDRRDKRGRLDQRLSETEKAKADAEAVLQRMTAEGDIATQQNLDDARRHRDTGWSLIRAAWLEGTDDKEALRSFAGDTPLPDAYEHSVVRADEISDELRTDAKRVAEAAQLRANIADADKKIADIEKEREALADRAEVLQVEWRKEWERTGLAEPKPPKEMREWWDAHREVAQQVGRTRTRNDDFQRLDAKRSELVAGIVAAARAVGTDIAAAADGKLPPVLAAGRNALKEIEGAIRRRDALVDGIASLEDERVKATAKLETAQADLTEWQEQWVAVAAGAGCDPLATTAEVQAKITSLDELFAAHDELDKLESRIAGIGGRAERFADNVKAAVSTVAQDLAGLDPTQAAVELNNRLSRAREDATRLDGLREQEAEATERLQEAQSVQKGMEAHLKELCALAGVVEIAALADAEARSEQLSTANDTLASCDDELRKLFGAEQLEKSIAEAEQCDPEDLEAERSSLDRSLNGKRDELSTLDKESGELENRLTDFVGSRTAADADQEALACLAEIQQKAATYMRLRLASAILRHHIDGRSNEEQNPLLDRASNLFARITCGAFKGLDTELDNDGERYVVGVRPDGDEELSVDQMSEGTRDQLFLALRLAYVEHYLKGREPVPFIVDDILINFDDDRALATLKVLAEFSRLTQVVFFTHHRHLAEIAADLIKKGQIVFHELPGRQVAAEELAV